MELRRMPPDCSICKKADNVTLIDGCLWICSQCRYFLNDLKSDNNKHESEIKESQDIRFWTKE